jgi:hypothetical protein
MLGIVFSPPEIKKSFRKRMRLFAQCMLRKDGVRQMPQNIHIYASAGKLCFYWNLLSSVYLVIIQHFFRFVNTFLQSFLCFLMFFTKKIRPARAERILSF